MIKTLPGLARIVLLAVTMLGAACVSLEVAAPPVEALPMTVSAGKQTQLAQGRLIYITKCAKCHSVEPVKKYPREAWEHEIIPEMAKETNLDAAETEAVRAYVLAVLRS
jgi:mono/diheme cytochrome c family protein